MIACHPRDITERTEEKIEQVQGVRANVQKVTAPGFFSLYARNSQCANPGYPFQCSANYFFYRPRRRRAYGRGRRASTPKKSKTTLAGKFCLHYGLFS